MQISRADSDSKASGYPPALREIAADVFAYIQPDGGWCVNNAGLLVGDDANVLIDTAATEARSRRLREQVIEVARTAPRLLVNTHSHGDHTFGNFLFPEATVIAHAETRREMEQAGLHLTDLWPDIDWGDLKITLPALTYRESVTLHVGGHAVQLLHLGAAHSTNDTLVWLPDQRVLFAGDVVMSGVTPFCQLGSIAGSLRAIASMRALEPVTVVTGHGPVTGPEVLDVTERYLRWVQQLAASGIAAGLTPLEVARDAGPGDFGALLEPERIIPNLHRAFAEERGAERGELDVSAVAREMGAIFLEMIEYHGGPLVSQA